MTINIRGQPGSQWRIASRIASEPAPTTSVVTLVSGICSSASHSSSTYEPSPPGTPSSLCDWSMMIPIEKPSTKPAITAFERKVETQPIRRSPRAR
jgi:hypothetical protein